jgi:hypothetical protein
MVRKEFPKVFSFALSGSAKVRMLLSSPNFEAIAPYLTYENDEE